VTLWTRRAVTLNFNNVPDHGYADAHANETALPDANFKSRQELWHRDCRRAVRRASGPTEVLISPAPKASGPLVLEPGHHTGTPEAHLFDELAQSVVISVDTANGDRVVATHQLRLHRRVFGLFGLVSDARWLVDATVELVTKRRVIHAGWHPTPTGNRKGPLAARAARRARSNAYDRVANWIRAQHYPIILAGDTNDEHAADELRHRLPGHRIEVYGVGIDQVLAISSAAVEVNVSGGELVKVPHTDHPGAVVVDVTAVAR
jgi:hypothetical protein